MRREEFSYSRIEALLQDVYYKDFLILDVSASFFIINNLNKRIDKSLKNTLKSIILSIYTFMFGFRRKGTIQTAEIEKYEGAVLFTLSSDRNHFFNLNYALMKNLGSGFAVLYSGRKVNMKLQTLSIEDGLENYLSMDYLAVPNIGLNDWRTHFIKVLKQVLRKRSAIIDQIGKSAFIQFLDHLINQTQRYEASLILLKQLKPSSVVVESDRYNENAPLVLAANRLLVPSRTHVHGLLNVNFGYIPLLANKVYAWGEIHRKWFANHGVAPERILITGSPLDIHAIKQNSNRGNQPYCLLLATNPVSEWLRFDMVRFYVTVISKITYPCKGYIKLHPGESRRDYDSIQLPVNVEIVESRDKSNEDILKEVDLVLVHNSAFAIDAAFAGVAVRIIEIEGSDLGLLSTLIEEGYFKKVAEPYHLSQEINLSIEDGNRLEPNTLFPQEYISFSQEKAISIIINELK